MICNLLFVYGTLMRCEKGRMGRLQRRRLAREGQYLGAGCINGELYDLGDYPGFVLAPESEDVVHGEVIELITPRPTLKWLDAYEGDSPGGGRPDEYLRLQATVQLQKGGNCQAWVYVYDHSVARVSRIRGGRWSQR